MRRRTSESHSRADLFPPVAASTHPDDLRVDRLQPSGPAERRLHPVDRGRGRRWQPHGLRRLANDVRELDLHCRPCAEVAAYAYELKSIVARHQPRFWCSAALSKLPAAPVYLFSDQDQFDSDAVWDLVVKRHDQPLRLP